MPLLTEQSSDAPPPNGNPYQNIEVLVKAALDHKSAAIHPGYGCLSEDAEFARRVQEAKILFLGHAPKSMEVLGNKDPQRSISPNTHPRCR
jgi:acetyl/propionyl-CoA carboxylase alpha subunit